MTRKPDLEIPDLETLVRRHIPDHIIGSVQGWCAAMAEGEYEAADLIARLDLPGLLMMLQHVTPKPDAAAPVSTEVH